MVEFVGGPWDGDVREIPVCRQWLVPIPTTWSMAEEPPPVYEMPRRREHVYEWGIYGPDGKRYLVWQGER